MKIQLIAWALLSSAFIPAPAFAYIPPSSFIIKSLAAKHTGIKGIRIRSKVTAMEGEKLSAIRFREVTYFNPATLTLRAYAIDDSGKKLFGTERKLDTATAADALLFWPNAKALTQNLKNKGIPIRTEDELHLMKDNEERYGSEEEWLARWLNSIAWVIGKESKKGGAQIDLEAGPQLWVEKDTFLPLRLIVSAQNDEKLIDLQFEGQRYYHEFPYPRVITVVKKGSTPLIRDEVQDVVLSLDTKEFGAAAGNGFTDAGNASPEPMRDLVQQYFDMVR